MGNEHRDLLGRDVLASDGAKLGHIADVYVDPDTGAPKWLVVPTGLFASTVSFVPAEGAGEDEDGRVVIAYTRKAVRKAPHPAADGDLSPSEEAELARHYVAAARASAAARARAHGDLVEAEPTVETNLADVPPAATGDRTDEWLVGAGSEDGTSMVRAEEELRTEKATRPSTRARLVKKVVTEEVTFTVPVRREVLTLEYEDVAEGELVPPPGVEPFGPMPDQEIVLYAEIVEYEKKVVPKERVRLRKEVVEEVIDIRTDLRKEHVDVVGAPEATLI